MARDMSAGPAAEKKLEQYGVWVKVEPREVLAGAAPTGLSDLEPPEARPAKGSSLTDEEEQLLDELQTGMDRGETAEELPELELEQPAAEGGLEELTAEEAVEVPLSDERRPDGRYDDLESLDAELSTARGPAAVRGVADSASAGVLSRIEAELRSIRSDLTVLKKELADLRRAPAPAAAGAETSESEAAAVFFEEDEDETIALTGDELDNILNTADITEESAESPPLGGDLELEPAEAAAPAEAAPLELEPIEEAAEEPAELVLEGLETPATGATGAADLPLELEGVPEIEAVEEAELEELEELGEQAAAKPAGEEPLGELEELSEVEELPIEEATPAPAPEAGEVDLEALAAEQKSIEEPVLSTEDISDSDIAELEAVTEGESGESEPEAAIEIDFEQAPAAPTTEKEKARPAPKVPPAARPAAGGAAALPEDLKDEIRKVLKYMDQLLEALPEEKIQEFAGSDYFAMYRKLFEDLGLGP